MCTFHFIKIQMIFYANNCQNTTIRVQVYVRRKPKKKIKNSNSFYKKVGDPNFIKIQMTRKLYKNSDDKKLIQIS